MARRPFPWTFRYEEELRVEGSDFLRKPLLRPVVLIRMAGARVGEHNVAALVDSGCDHVVAAPWVAQDIGVTPDSSRQIRVRIGGASRTVRFADVSLHLLPPEAPLAEGSTIQQMPMSGGLKLDSLPSGRHSPGAFCWARSVSLTSSL